MSIRESFTYHFKGSQAMRLEERRRQLAIELAKGVSNRKEIDEILNCATARMEDDLRGLLALADTTALRRLAGQLCNGQVVRGAYRGPNGSECLAASLLRVESNDEMVNYPYPSVAALDQVSRIMRNWDYLELDSETALRIVEDVIGERALLNAQEEDAVRRATAKLRLESTI